MKKPYTIKLFVPNGNPNSLKIIDKLNWTGIGLEVAREAWDEHKVRSEFDQAGVYILIGYKEDEDNLPTLYIGQGDGVKSRIDSHIKKKTFWDKALVFTSSNRSLNRAHITWLEYKLIQQAKDTKRCYLDNSTSPSEPILTESEKADTLEFFYEILSILPLLEIRVFTPAKKLKVDPSIKQNKANILDTIVVPAQEEGFKAVFLDQNCWYAIRIGGGKLNDIKYIAAYQTAPVSAITHVAEVDSIEPYGDGGKYKLNFTGSAKEIDFIKFGNAKSGSLQGARYTSFNKLKNAKTLVDLWG